jgi:uncharacterized protein (TIGR03118 family)
MPRLSLTRWSACVVAVLAVGLVSTGVAAANRGDDGQSEHHKNSRHDGHFGPGYTVTRLVSDEHGVAPNTDPNLVNAWGLVAGPGTPWWVANNGTNTSTLYDGLGTLFPPPPNGPLVVSVPCAPTGTVFNGGANFKVSNGTTDVASKFIFATEGGTILGWPGGVTAAVQAVDSSASGAVYKGLAIDGDMLYATDFANGKVDVFDGSWNPVVMPGAFTDPFMPAGYGPFGIQNLNGNIFVTYAKQQAGSTDERAGHGLGIVDEYSPTGAFEQRVGSFRGLNAPWGLAWAPADGFGTHSGELLVGNFGDGRINVFVQRPWGQWLSDSQLRDHDGHRITIDGLWALAFGNGTNNAPTTSLYFTAGPDEESHGLFGTVTANP